MHGENGARREEESARVSLNDAEVEVGFRGIVPPRRLEFAQVVAASAVGSTIEYLGDSTLGIGAVRRGITV